MAFLTRLSGWTVGLPSICYKVFRSTAVRPPQRRSYSPLPRYAARPYMIEGNSPPSAQPAWLLPAHPNPEPLFPNIEHLVPGEAVFLQGLDSRLAARAYQVNRALASRHICFQLRALSVNLRDTDKFDRYIWNVILQMTWKPTQLQLISITFHYVKHIRYSPLRSVVLNIFPVFKAISRCMCLTHAQIDGMILNQRSAEAGN